MPNVLSTSSLIRDHTIRQAGYFQDPGPPGGESKQGQDKELQRNLWQLCEGLVKEKLGEGALKSWTEVKGQ